MRALPDQPNLHQLRRQARELQRAAAAGDLAASERIRAVSRDVTLSAAQLALAREHGFPSWAQLKAEVERRRRRPPAESARPRYVIRPVASLQELVETFDVIGAQMTPPIRHDDRRFDELARRFPEDRSLMLVGKDRGRVIGGALGFRKVSKGGSGVTLRMLGLRPVARGHGLGRRLMGTLEVSACRLGAPAINLGGASGEIKRFYARLGYSGRGSMMSKGLPLPGRFLEARLRQLAEAVGDLPVSDQASTERPR